MACVAGEIWTYEKDGAPVDGEVVSAAADFFQTDELVAYEDGRRGFVSLRRMLSDLKTGRPGAIVIASLVSLGQSLEDRRGVLEALMKSGAVVLVCDCPHVRAEMDPALNRAALGGLWDAAFGTVCERVHVGVRPGRRQIDYPDGWEDLYDAWQAGEMTARALMEQTGLKRGTFYHLASAWRDELEARAAG